MKPATKAVHAGYSPRAREAMNPPIHQTSVYVYEEVDDYDAVAGGARPGHTYGRTSNENVDMLAAAVAELEGGEAGVAASSGTAALMVTLMALCPKPRPIVAPRDLYGGTWVLLRSHFEPAGYEIRWTDLADEQGLQRALEGAGLVLCETITNPLQHVSDLPTVIAAARTQRVPVVVDNTYATPILCRPLELGATAVVHSATKYIGGHWDLVAGAAAGDEWTMIAARDAANRLGTTLGPFEALLALRGLRTLGLRMLRHSANALALATALERCVGAGHVHYPLLASSPYRGLAERLLPDGAGGMLAFELPDRAAEQRLTDKLKLVRFAASFGGTETAISHPEVTSHRYLSVEERAAMGITPGTVRVSAGIEDPEDVIEDFTTALAQI